MNLIKPLIALSALALASLALAAPAFAAERFALPTGDGVSSDCLTQATACTLERAVETVAADGDVITVLPGNYSVTDVVLSDDAVEIRGAPGQARPVLTSSATSGGLTISDPAAVLRRMEVVHNPLSGAAAAVTIGVDGGTVEQVVARSSTATGGAAACRTLDSAPAAVFRDTSCVATNNASGMILSTGPGSTTTTLRNVTTIGTASQAGIVVGTQAGETAAINATNAIVNGGGIDINVQGAGTSTFSLDHSNYNSVTAGAGATVSPVGSATNQTAAPLLVDTAAGDVHQLAASPTRNAGVGGAGLGSADFDGESRFLGTAPDIGADEFTEAPLPPSDGGGGGDTGGGGNTGGGADSGGGGGDTGGGDGGGPTPDTDDPETEITKKPKKALSAGDTAKVSFESDEGGAIFECRIGKGKFKACSSPVKVKNLKKGKTKVQIRAVDAAGNVDETPAKLTIEAGGRGDRS